MPDKFNKKIRSRIMSKIRSKDTKIEILLRRELWKQNMRGYRIHSSLLGKPDIAYTKKKLILFIDGDFWHGYNWLVLKKIPPKGYWRKKIKKNIIRDHKNTLALKKEGWKVIRIWEHEIDRNITGIIKKIRKVYGN